MCMELLSYTFSIPICFCKERAGGEGGEERGKRGGKDLLGARCGNLSSSGILPIDMYVEIVRGYGNMYGSSMYRHRLPMGEMGKK